MNDDKLRRIRRISVNGGISPWQKYALIGLMIGLAILTVRDPIITVSWIVQGLILMYGVIVTFSAYVYTHAGREAMAEIPEDKLLPFDRCPRYDILLPCRGEEAILRQLVERMESVIYPHDKLFVWLLIDEYDESTLAAARKLYLPDFIKLVVTPNTFLPWIKGKPRALMNAAQKMGLVKGAYCVVYDAEDLPDPDQLLKAATAFALYPEISVFQASLRWWNANQNFFTRMRALGYSLTELRNAGLCATNCIVPLGGTSNHFRVSTLEAVGWWDPFNVTEDLDLGVKLRRAGFRTMLLPSITWEEATSSFRTQRNQSSRWTKGHMTTAIAHTRNPLLLARDLGFRGTVSFVAVVGSMHPAALVAPAFWVMTLTYAGTGASIIQRITPFAAFYIGLICSVAVMLFVISAMCAVIRTGQERLWIWTLFLPIHWATVEISAAAKAALELLRGDYFSWNKTAHVLLHEERKPSFEPNIALESITAFEAD